MADRVGGGEVSEEPGLLVIPKIAHTPDGFPRQAGRCEKASARLSRLARWRGSMRLRTRRAGSERPRPRSISPPASRRRARSRSSSTSIRRRTRPRVSARARTGPRATTCSTACRSPSSRSRRGSRTSRSSRPRRRSQERSSSSRAATTATGTSRESLAEGTDAYEYVFLDCPPSLGPLTVNALAAADRVLVPVQAEYYALEGLAEIMRSIELVKTRLNPRLVVAGLLMTMVDSRTRLAQDVEREVRTHFGDLVFRDDGASLGPPRRSSESRAPRDCLRPPVARRRRVLEGGDGACRARLNARAWARASRS